MARCARMKSCSCVGGGWVCILPSLVPRTAPCLTRRAARAQAEAGYSGDKLRERVLSLETKPPSLPAPMFALKAALGVPADLVERRISQTDHVSFMLHALALAPRALLLHAF